MPPASSSILTHPIHSHPSPSVPIPAHLAPTHCKPPQPHPISPPQVELISKAAQGSAQQIANGSVQCGWAGSVWGHQAQRREFWRLSGGSHPIPDPPASAARGMLTAYLSPHVNLVAGVSSSRLSLAQQAASHLDPTWIPPGSHLNQTWVPSGSHLDHTWITPGSHLDPSAAQQDPSHPTRIPAPFTPACITHFRLRDGPAWWIWKALDSVPEWLTCCTGDAPSLSQIRLRSHPHPVPSPHPAPTRPQ